MSTLPPPFGVVGTVPVYAPLGTYLSRALCAIQRATRDLVDTQDTPPSCNGSETATVRCEE